jgi:DNA-directed RNA polymerase specialized sigma24 family protein
MIRAASGEFPNAEVMKAWEELVERYKDPVKNAVTRLMRHHPAAEESQNLLDKAEPKIGRFRCFMQGVIKRYVKQAARSQKSGTFEIAENDQPFTEESPEAEQREEREWAMTVMQNATRTLVRVCPRDGELLLKAFGIAPYELTPRRTLCKESGLNKSALTVAIHRARERLRALIVSEIKDMVGSDEDFALESEIIGERLMNARPALFGDEESFIEWSDDAGS